MSVKRYCDRCRQEIHLPPKVRPIEASLLYDARLIDPPVPAPLMVNRERVELCLPCANELGTINKTFMKGETA